MIWIYTASIMNVFLLSRALKLTCTAEVVVIGSNRSLSACHAPCATNFNKRHHYIVTLKLSVIRVVRQWRQNRTAWPREVVLHVRQALLLINFSPSQASSVYSFELLPWTECENRWWRNQKVSTRQRFIASLTVQFHDILFWCCFRHRSSAVHCNRCSLDI